MECRSNTRKPHIRIVGANPIIAHTTRGKHQPDNHTQTGAMFSSTFIKGCENESM